MTGGPSPPEVTIMSMCHIGFRAGSHVHVAYLHYAQGTLDWRKYHAQWETKLGEHAERCLEASRPYFEKTSALHGRMKLGYDPIHADGCERAAAEHGCWTCEDAKQQARWRKMVREFDDSNHVSPDHCALFLDFTARHATIRDRQFASWEDYLPDGWTWELKEIGKG